MPKRVKFGSLRRLTPISSRWGFDRGTPIDRHYIEAFLDDHASRIRGSVVEVRNRRYTERFGGDHVEVSEILDVDPTNRKATIIADIQQVETFEPDRFDCVVFTQTLQFIREPARALETIQHILKPGGTLLLSCPGITRIDAKGATAEWYWSFTPLSLKMLLADAFGPENVSVAAFGNVFVASCFLWGIATEEIDPEELAYQDPRYPVILTACATKARDASSRR